MTTTFLVVDAFLVFIFASLAAFAQVSFAQVPRAPDDAQEVSLDIDGDGKMDRAALVKQNDGAADLSRAW